MKKIDKTLQRINEIKYEVVSETSQESYKINVSDSHEIIIDDSDSFKIIHKRSISFEPKGLYNLLIESEVNFILKDCENDDTGAQEFSHEFIEEHVEDLINQYSTIFETVSFLISNISSSLGRTPIITQPSYIKIA